MSTHKIIEIDQLAEVSQELRQSGKQVVHCHGTFDLMHTGHIRYLQKAREEGDVLLVTVTADAFVNKGPGRPVFNEYLRAENLAALACVDFVAINHEVSAVSALHKIRPNVYVKGSDYRTASDDLTGNISREQQAVEAHGGRIFFTDEITFSSSNLLNEHFNVFSPETRNFLKDFRGRWRENDMQAGIESLRELKVLVVGDAIIDQYHYATPLGQTGKGNIFAVRYESEEQFAGGSLAVANHLAGFAGSVTLLTALGSYDSHEEFIRQKLRSNIETKFFYFVDAPTVTKRRFVDADLAKLFEVYFYHDEPQVDESAERVCDWLLEHLALFDAVIVPDFGNGFIGDAVIRTLGEKARFLAVNTQINSGNRGYHFITRYPRTSFVSLNEPELRMAAHNRRDSLENIARAIAIRTQTEHLAVTRGTKGVILYDRNADAFHHIPALSTKVVDRIGAGDAFLSLAGLCAARGLDPEVTAFIGSVAAAMDVQIVCNRHPVDSVGLKKYVATLMK